MTEQVSLLVATRSVGKMRELMPMLNACGFAAQSLADIGLVESADEASLEVFDTFEANALAKARWFSARSGGRVVLADDSGLCVDALDGAPGVRSKRWAGLIGVEGDALDAANREYLLQQLIDAAKRGRCERAAHFVCAAALVWPSGELVHRGQCNGTIERVPSGIGGFGYDPLFRSDELGVTFAAAPHAEKDSVSHRGRAMRSLLSSLRVAEAPGSRIRRCR